MAKEEKIFYGVHDEDYDRWGDFPGVPIKFIDSPKKDTGKKTEANKKTKAKN